MQENFRLLPRAKALGASFVFENSESISDLRLASEGFWTVVKGMEDIKWNYISISDAEFFINTANQYADCQRKIFAVSSESKELVKASDTLQIAYKLAREKRIILLQMKTLNNRCVVEKEIAGLPHLDLESSKGRLLRTVFDMEILKDSAKVWTADLLEGNFSIGNYLKTNGIKADYLNNSGVIWLEIAAIEKKLNNPTDLGQRGDFDSLIQRAKGSFLSSLMCLTSDFIPDVGRRRACTFSNLSNLEKVWGEHWLYEGKRKDDGEYMKELNLSIVESAFNFSQCLDIEKIDADAKEFLKVEIPCRFIGFILFLQQIKEELKNVSMSDSEKILKDLMSKREIPSLRNVLDAPSSIAICDGFIKEVLTLTKIDPEDATLLKATIFALDEFKARNTSLTG